MGDITLDKPGKAELRHKYNSLVQEALDSVKHNQHLRWIGYIFRTKQVCLEALKSDIDCGYCYSTRSINFIPLPIIDEVIDELGKIMFTPGYTQEPKPRYQSVIPELRKIAKKRKEQAAKDPNYYDENSKTFEEVLKECGAKDFEDMLYIRFTESR
jgi:hypothetical protein